MAKKFMDKTNATSVLTEYASHIKNLEPTEITWANYQLLTPEQKAAKRYMIIDYPETLENVNNKADKVDGATNGNFAGLDANGNLTDSGHKHSDYLTEAVFQITLTGSGTQADPYVVDKTPAEVDAAIVAGKVIKLNSLTLSAKVESNNTYIYSFAIVTAVTSTFVSGGIVNLIRSTSDDTTWTTIYGENATMESYVTPVMQTASAALEGKIYQYIGVTNSSYTNGYFYKCVSDGAVSPTYSWEQLNVQPTTIRIPVQEVTGQEDIEFEFVGYNAADICSLIQRGFVIEAEYEDKLYKGNAWFYDGDDYFSIDFIYVDQERILLLQCESNPFSWNNPTWTSMRGYTKILFGDIVGVSNGGTGQTTLTRNAVLTGNNTSAINSIPTASGALYATAANGAASFGTLPVAQGGTGATTLDSGKALIGNGTSAVTTRAITNNTSASTAPTGTTNLATMNSLSYGLAYALGRSGKVTDANTNYTTTMARGIYATTTDLTAGTTALTNGVIALVYE